MFKKQIQKLILLGLSTLILFSFFPFLMPNQALALDKGCLSAKDVIDFRKITKTDLSLKPVMVDGKQSAMTGDFTLTYEENSAFATDQSSCNTNNIASFAVIGWSGGSYTENKTVTNLQIDPSGGILKISGHLDFPDLKTDIKSSYFKTIQGYSGSGPKDGSDFYKGYLYLYFTEIGRFPNAPAKTEDLASGTMYFYGCNDHKDICVQTNDASSTGSDPVEQDALKMYLTKFVLGMDITPKDHFPPAVKDNPKLKFVRTYIKDDKTIDGFNIAAQTLVMEPKGKTFYIKSGENTSQFYVDDGKENTFKPKAAKKIGAGAFNKTIKANSATDYGCIKESFDTTYVADNSSFRFNYCNTAVGSFVEKDVNLPIDGNAGLDTNLFFGGKSFDNLKVSKIVACKDTKEWKDCDDAVNTIQIAPFLVLENTFGDDTNWKGSLFASPMQDIKNLSNSYNYWGGVPLVYKPQDLYIQVYPNVTAYNAHKDDPPPASVTEQDSSVSSAQSDTQGATSTLYDFIVRVLSQIIIIITGAIYKIFAFFVIPVLKALLQVKPYKDAFVNIIYPGWLIIRNLSNIFFIVALLVVGMKILFQQAASGTAVSFIRRLLIMALLVNFSLVIAQGIVAIADTVQAQFLPENSQVIEALGTKLMVEPIQSFRTAVTDDDAGTFTKDATFSDIAKPIVLLVLCVAAFFSFIAIAAFLAVRIVVLLVLYMASPIAYVGYVMDDTRKWSGMWWDEFIKYAFLTPILVFFLNMAALVATVTSSSHGSVIKLDDTLSGDLVTGGLTIATHFIVLIFLYVGMYVATKSGTIGSKTIVDYAKKGFDWTTKSLPRIAKDTAIDGIARTGAVKGRPGLERAIRTIGRPIEAGKALKKGYFDIPNERMNKRFEKSFGALTQTGVKYGDDKLLPAKMAYWKLTGQNSAAVQAQADEIAEKQNILTPEDLAKKKKEFKDKNGLESDDADMYGRGEMSVRDASKHMKSMDSDLDARQKELQQIEEELEDPEIKDKRRTRLEKEKREKETEISRLETIKGNLKGRTDAAAASGTNVDFKGLEAEIKPYFDSAAVKEAVNSLNEDLDRDKELRRKFGVTGVFTDADKKQAKEAWQALENKAASRDWPDSPGDRAERNARAEKEGENYKDIDDKDALVQGFKQALKQNNPDQALFISKKMAKAGLMDDLLHEMDELNNVDGLKNLVEKGFSNLSRTARANIGMDLSYLAGQNGNKALQNAVAVTGPNGRAWKSVDRQQADNAPLASKKHIKDMSSNDFRVETSKGKFKLQKGVVEHINSYNHEAGLKSIRENLSADKAKAILGADGSDRILEDVKKAIEDVRGGRGKKKL